MNHTIASTRFARWLGVCAVAAFACAPRAGKLTGTAAPARFPATELPRGNQRIVFRWDYIDQALAAKGEGVARIASPDSVRLDFFLDGGLGGGYAIVIGDSISTPGGGTAKVLSWKPSFVARSSRTSIGSRPAGLS